jgi:hypothetical protein
MTGGLPSPMQGAEVEHNCLETAAGPQLSETKLEFFHFNYILADKFFSYFFELLTDPNFSLKSSMLI